MSNSDQYIQISSKYRTNPNDQPGSCRIDMPQILTAGTYRLVYALIPNTFYTVNASNNQLVLNEGGHNIFVTLVNGFYTNTTFPVMLKQVLDGTGTQSYTVALSIVTNKITIQAVSAFMFVYNADTTNNAHILVGLPPADTAMDVSLVCPNMINLSPVHTLNMSIDDVSSISQRNLQGTTFIIPIPAGSLSYVNYISQPSFDQTVTFHSSKRVITIRLRDELNLPIDLNGIDWMIVLSKVENKSADFEIN